MARQGQGKRQNCLWKPGQFRERKSPLFLKAGFFPKLYFHQSVLDSICFKVKWDLTRYMIKQNKKNQTISIKSLKESPSNISLQLCCDHRHRPEYFPDEVRYLWFCDEYLEPNSHTGVSLCHYREQKWPLRICTCTKEATSSQGVHKLKTLQVPFPFFSI